MSYIIVDAMNTCTSSHTPNRSVLRIVVNRFYFLFLSLFSSVLLLFCFGVCVCVSDGVLNAARVPFARVQCVTNFTQALSFSINAFATPLLCLFASLYFCVLR